ncbi:transcription-repair coupling factor [Candidatus Viridilinea mediisalina]|uniref:Transcription-repair-coupling factor n=1 Tax=Candidatus Viridilinea mediisalina TaxID=2024553 RepID=A0A2A6RHE2_9CHLR|nr:transcription-repair coupling factor [Candidatus Viridilinea mediisalina]PDW02487.1 transcription-repair coupling factor [Candidatus Viridilinea mediisalina]
MPTLSQITAALAAHPDLTDLAATLGCAAGRWRVAPLPAAARPPIVAALAQLLDAPLLYLLPSPDAALRVAEDLGQWCDAERILLYPAADALPYEHMSPGNQVLAARLRVLHALHTLEAAPKPIIVAPVKALLQPTLTPAELAEATLRLQRGQQLNQDALLRALVTLGYRSHPTVEQQGEFVRRGDIVDLWPLAAELPLRLEFFGDELDNLRCFDPETQRSAARLASALIGPPHEIPLWKRETALARLAELDCSALRPEALAEWQENIARIEHGLRFEGRAFYAPFFRAGSGATLLAHLPANATVLLSEVQFLVQHATALHDHAADQRARQIEAGELPAAFPRPYFLWEEAMPPATQPACTLVDLSNNAPTTMLEDGFRPLSLGELQFMPPELFGGQFRRLVEAIVTRSTNGQHVVAVTNQAARLQELVEQALSERGLEGRKQEVVSRTDASRGLEGRKQEVVSRTDASRGLEGRKQEVVSRTDASTSRVSPHASRITHHASRLTHPFQVHHATIDGGWELPALNLVLYSDVEIFGLRQRRPLGQRRKRSGEDRSAFLRGLKVGDYVVHIEHGIARYNGLIRRTVGEIEREYLVLAYAASDKIYVPVDQVDRVTRYIGSGDGEPTLTRLGTQDWERAKRKARAAVEDMAEELLKLYAQRQLKHGHAFGPDGEWQHELEAAFPFIETDDQLRAVGDVKADMEQHIPMDRLICGDVGFGKTEVALRAAFKAVQDGKQVAVLVPTTVLAQQHYDTFTKRLAAFPLRVQMLSRFRSTKEQDEIIRALAKGQVDILIGTHRLLSRDVQFRDLGLVIVDEEQRFGVRHKERLKQLRTEVDVLTLTATPIPRTLHMAMAGIRDLSVIDTPPEDRVPIKTYVLPYSDQLIREAIEREIEREGQVYFVHNRVHSIYHIANRLRGLIPEARIAVGHGQMADSELERVMLAFFEGRYDVLVSTTIIESGLDVPNANTIIIDDATHYGLAQLYQLRGRVGRSSNRAYAYLLYKQDKPMTPEAQARLEAIQEATELGAGFRVAMRDLEIRGTGNLLGSEQSGHIAAIGFDLYTRLLEQAVGQLKQQVDAQRNTAKAIQREAPAQPANAELPEPTKPSGRSGTKGSAKLILNEKILVSPLVTLDLPLTAYLPTSYISDDQVRLAVYQRMVEAQTSAEVRALRNEIEDRFGPPPAEALHLLIWLQIKALALQAGVSSIVATNNEFTIRLPVLSESTRERLRRNYRRDSAIKIGPQFLRLDRYHLGERWIEKLISILEVLKSS